MLVEIARPITLCVSLLSLYAVFHRAFLIPGVTIHDRIWNSLGLLVLAGCIALVGGMLFREQQPSRPMRLSATLPVRVFFWGAMGMVLFFFASWYLETYCIFYRDVRF